MKQNGKISIISLNFVSIIYMCMSTEIECPVYLFLIRVKIIFLKATDLERLLEKHISTVLILNSSLTNPIIHWQERLASPGWCSSGLNTGLRTKGSQVPFSVRACGWVVGQAPSGVRVTGNHTLMFLCLSLPLPLCLKINKIFKKKSDQLNFDIVIQWILHSSEYE